MGSCTYSQFKRVFTTHSLMFHGTRNDKNPVSSSLVFHGTCNDKDPVSSSLVFHGTRNGKNPVSPSNVSGVIKYLFSVFIFSIRCWYVIMHNKFKCLRGNGNYSCRVP
jgi:hypothetical protein